MNRGRYGVLAAVTAVLLAASGCILGRSSAALAVLAGLLILLAASIAAMTVRLRSSLRETLYNYRNIGLIGGMLFSAMLLLALLHLFVRCCMTASVPTAQVVYRAVLDFPRQFSLYAVAVILVVCVLVGVSNVALIRHEGFCLNNVLSLVIGGFYVGGTGFAYWITDFLERRVFIPQGWMESPGFVALYTGVALFLVLMLCYLECVLAGTAIMGWLAARQKPQYDKDYIIILGCSIDRRGGLLPLLKGRVNRAIRFAWEQEIDTGKPVHYVPSGGQGANEIMSEGSAMELYLLSRGAESYEIFPEKQSRNTWENMRLSKQVIDALQPGARVAFATTNYHMLRSGILAQRAGLDAEGIAGDTKWYFWPNGFVREFFGILALNVRTHVCVAAVAAALCAIIGCVGCLGGLI